MMRPSFSLKKDFLSIDESVPKQCEGLRNLIISEVAVGDKYCIAISRKNNNEKYE